MRVNKHAVRIGEQRGSEGVMPQSLSRRKDFNAQRAAYLLAEHGLAQGEIGRMLGGLSQSVVSRLLKHAEEPYRTLFLTAILTGMRRGEILGLKWSDIDFKRDIMTLHDTKNGERREVYMNEQVKTAFIRTPKNPTSPYVFCGSNGKPCRDIRKSFWTALRISDIKDFHFHDLRHTFASQLVMSGVDLNTVRELLGHKSMQMTLRYSHLSPNHKQNAVDVLSKKMDTIWTPSQKPKKLPTEQCSVTI